MAKPQPSLLACSRSKSLCAVNCFCLMVLGLFILASQSGPLNLMWTNYHLHNLADSPLLSVVPFASTNCTGYSIRPVPPATAQLPLPPLLQIKADPCTCLLRILDIFNPNVVFPQHVVNCTCPSTSTTTQEPGLRDSSFDTASSPSFKNEATQSSFERTGSALPNSSQNTTKQDTAIVKKPCTPQKLIVKVEEPWYVKGRSWHPPPRFPRCTMDACFNYSRCENSDELLIYTYSKPALPAKFFKGINESRYNTNDPNMACLYFVFLDTPGLYRPPLHPSKLPYWQGGLNHVLITFGDKWLNKGPAPESIGYASAMATVVHESTYRSGFDVSIPLPAKKNFPKLRRRNAFDRKYFMTFRGLRYLQNDGVLRSFTEFRRMHNGEDVIVATSCRHPNHKDLRRDNATLDAECRRDEALYDKHSYLDLMNTTFGLAPAGRQPNSYRFAELLSAGVVPVLIADNYVKPYDKLVQWHRCILQFPSTELRRVLKTVRAMKREEVERRQKYCLRVYARWFAGDDALFEASMEAQKVRFMGTFPRWPSISNLD